MAETMVLVLWVLLAATLIRLITARSGNVKGVTVGPHTVENQGCSPMCWAHAISKVLRFAMLRIVSQEGGVPSFAAIRDAIIADYGPKPPNVPFDDILHAVVPPYRFRFQKISGKRILEAVRQGRAVLTRFDLVSLDGSKKKYPNGSANDEWSRFSSKAGTRVMQREDVQIPELNGPLQGHAVVLVAAAPGSVTFLNFWGSQWGDRGHFHVADFEVLRNMQF
uniref:Peptidase C1A papain C-terminal domain-containing protein n=1 Tax=Chromera velia CCMP2878 TaxID=1169474 RepID=A0A0G4FG60_9ALVE|eukprot:Cvel_16748.t1-p1 / transcript=Cvel_16748.t1 / gene=Cvel_16748 / organism=Chromera_velia_CCMP2878 / gene_product=hypothetical protein / transcript_product=hypothetical protein / location=Cvel_scaffold1304:44428-45090(-) / protein_length=221 / sequence_SO=supercontig / SO=protein_coding / is_pseudo=false